MTAEIIAEIIALGLYMIVAIGFIVFLILTLKFMKEE